jgi:pyruvyltransferase
LDSQSNFPTLFFDEIGPYYFCEYFEQEVLEREAIRVRTLDYYLYRLRRIASSTFGEMNHNGINAFWELRFSNSGDLITPVLLKFYGFTPVHSYPNEASLFSCGSIMEKVPQSFSGYILGTGFMYRDSIRSLTQARILALRGELTREKIGASKDTVLGDPGLLVSRFLRKRQKKQFKLGIIPHFVDKKDECIRKFSLAYPRDVLVIDIQGHPLDVLKNVDKCDYIVSSSLHGLVFADSLEIPNAWVTLSDRVSGKGFKFYDYNSALGKIQEPLIMTGSETPADFIKVACLPSNPTVEALKDKLDNAFRLLRTEVLPH